MIRYAIALFLINTYSSSLGAPAVPQTSTPTITELLDSLAKNCGNVFIRTQIGISLQNCSTTDQNRLFECLIFYDINSQLCSAINNTKKFKLDEEEFSAQVKKEFNVKDLCNYASDWTFSNMNVSLSKVFQDPVKCEKLCGVYDVFSADSNFYCKYFDWGWKKLNPPKKTISETMSKVSSSAAISQGVIAASVEQGQKASSGSPNLTNSQIPTLNQNEEQEKNDLNDIEVPLPVTQRPSSEASAAQSSLPTVTMVSTNPGQGVKLTDNAKPSSDSNAGTLPNTNTSKNKLSSPLKPHSDQVPKNEDDNGDENLSFANEMDADDEDNIDDGDLAENPIAPKEIQTAEFSHKEYYTPDLGPEDDHFFPFFLTAIVLVVLVYILYHNKGRLTKIILGLIVEGRQNGRRRNSRGHAYRRLDTLEQAMSGNLAAQPSKIIY